MAAMQLQKSVTKTRTAIDQKQSLELIQTMLHSGLSTLAYIRDFFADAAFDETYYETSEKGYSYAEYASGNTSRNRRAKKERNHTKIQILRRGRTRRVDMFLDWLERGAFVALEAGRLNAVQIYIHPDDKSREKILEQYTFKISYTKTSQNQRSPTGLELETPGKVRMTVEDTSNALQALLREIAILSDVLPVLPAKRYISLALEYVEAEATDHCKLLGFVPTTTSRSLYAQARGWKQSSDIFTKLKTVFHGSTMEILSLQPLPNPSGIGTRHVRFPKLLEYHTGSEAQQDAHEVGAKTGPHNASPQVEVTPSMSNMSTASTASKDEPRADRGVDKPGMRLFTENAGHQLVRTPTVGIKPTAESLPKPRTDDTSHIESTQRLRDHDDLEMGAALETMMQPEHITQGDTQSQSVRPLESATAFSKSKVSPSQATHSPVKLTSGWSFQGHKPTLSRQKNEGLKQQRPTVDRCDTSKATESHDSRMPDVVDCHCGHMAEEGDMVNCTYCDCWQHLHCYGYLGHDDPRLPDEHVCYKCLLEDEEEAVSGKLMELSLKRRGIHFAQEHGLTTQQKFGKDMGWKPFRAGPMFAEYKRAGYIVNEKACQKGSDATKAHFVVVRSGTNHDKMLRTLFDPMMHIAHHYEGQPSPTALNHGPSGIRDSTMPPPATPASRLRPRKKTTTPGSGLDLSGSGVPFRTPSRTHPSLTRAQKRAREQSDSPDSASKRRVTMDSPQLYHRRVQSEFVLDASGMPSSPAMP